MCRPRPAALVARLNASPTHHPLQVAPGVPVEGLLRSLAGRGTCCRTRRSPGAVSRSAPPLLAWLHTYASTRAPQSECCCARFGFGVVVELQGRRTALRYSRIVLYSSTAYSVRYQICAHPRTRTSRRKIISMPQPWCRSGVTSSRCDITMSPSRMPHPCDIRPDHSDITPRGKLRGHVVGHSRGCLVGLSGVPVRPVRSVTFVVSDHP